MSSMPSHSTHSSASEPHHPRMSPTRGCERDPDRRFEGGIEIHNLGDETSGGRRSGVLASVDFPSERREGLRRPPRCGYLVAAPWLLRGAIRAIVDEVLIAVPPYSDENRAHDGAVVVVRRFGPSAV